MGKKYENIFLNRKKITTDYIYKGAVFDKEKIIPSQDRFVHGKKLIDRIEKIKENEKNKQVVSLQNYKGFYLDFESCKDFNLQLKSLESIKSNIRLMNVRYDDKTGKERATLFIPKGKEKVILKKIQDYCDTSKDNKNNKPKNLSLINTIEDIKEAVIDSFWIGKKSDMPTSEKKWCEIWIRSDKDEDITAFQECCKEQSLKYKKEILKFPERSVLLVEVNKDDIKYLILRSNLVAEIRMAEHIENYFYTINNFEEVEWANDLKERCSILEDRDVFVTILDGGVNNSHILIKDHLLDSDMKKYEEEWDINDKIGHGTQMAGVILYDDLQKKLMDNEKYLIEYGLESVKILPDNKKNPPELFGAITSDSVSRLIIDKPDRRRIICMAITAETKSDSYGLPTSWSAAIDESTSGYIDGIKKLYVISAGNIVYGSNETYPDKNILSPVQDPAQAWNCITVGGYTEKDRVNFEEYGLRETMAHKGELSPFSTTSMLFEKSWPIKPDVVFEAGNLMKDGEDWLTCEDLSVLTLDNKNRQHQFDSFWATSAATAFAANFLARLAARYKNAWPETLRGLMIHSAEWTPEMKKQFFKAEESKGHNVANLLRICGYGVPNFERAIESAENNVNIIIQSEIKPYKKGKNGNIVFDEMDVHEIPWPIETLKKLFDTEVEVKITLSYFIEPGPGEVGWKNKYRYPSCNLRFDLNGTLTKDELIGKISKSMQLGEEASTSNGINWTIGYKNRCLGSIHSDSWITTAANLINSNYIAVYPVTGWWKERDNLKAYDKKIRYSLIISLKTPKEETSLYTEIINKIKIENKVESKVIIETNND